MDKIEMIKVITKLRLLGFEVENTHSRIKSLTGCEEFFYIRKHKKYVCRLIIRKSEGDLKIVPPPSSGSRYSNTEREEYLKLIQRIINAN